MLSVGRALNLEEKVILCRKCLWEGSYTLLKTGFVPISGSKIRLYAYCCPACGSFTLGLKGKLLNFKGQNCIAHAQQPYAVEDANPATGSNGKIKKRDSD
jgi:hypothetical protein